LQEYFFRMQELVSVLLDVHEFFFAQFSVSCPLHEFFLYFVHLPITFLMVPYVL